MTDSNSSRLLRWFFGAIAGLTVLTGTAVADDTSSAKSTLPGVTSDYRIAKPAPQPEPDETVPGDGIKQFKIGDTDVRISGITVDVGAGAIGPSRH
ncbi:hypothetical protein LGH82_02325 [Mesorhizobium sp. PAMC28654]|uniref:hypothetical protein n=1 Tax=Mesorhizobium sp. PAMC28654 TaxID=2880934 RepID=UPI001D0AA171|nr:hypothetical protein [Mesorhizobium sp. PAMC28654]UDL90248.1 hypothetical protein LGH82_02325 [Mesorhizobium sp. PAMC28654]